MKSPRSATEEPNARKMKKDATTNNLDKSDDLNMVESQANFMQIDED